MIDIMYSDDGIGIPDGLDLRKSDSLGVKIIYSLSEHQLQGKAEFDVSQGLTCRISFTDALYQERL
jgi:two-component sensor histidine kinase